MAPDYTFNLTGLAHQNFDGSFVTHFIFATFLLLFTIPIRVQVVTIYNRIHFYRWFSVLFKNFHHIFQVVLGLYPLAQECCRLQKPALRTSQDLVQTSPPLDKLVFALMNRPILIHQPEESPLITSLLSQEILAPQQDCASIESEILTPQVPSTSTTDHHSINETPVHQVEPVLGTTSS